ncbi:MAG: cytochrome b/b6 domain-containing protein [Bauldia sp.]
MSRNQTTAASSFVPPTRVAVHPLAVRVMHWINAVAIVVMVMSGWRIYDASPLFGFSFPREITLGGWLGGALQWHFAAMWLVVCNTIAYLIYGVVSGHFRRSFFPVTALSVLCDIASALRGRLGHEVGVYNSVQRMSYIGVTAAIVMTVLSGLAIWKPTQFKALAFLMGGYEGGRLVHFFGMAAIVAFVVVHLALVLIVPSTFLPMISGWARKSASHNASTAKELP